ncbi:MAG: sulfatase [Candidatus Aminicenantes bacterium]|nr:sulfatase [Candidatus Aminicenantes bacterium]
MKKNKVKIAIIILSIIGTVSSIILISKVAGKSASYNNIILIAIDTLRADHLGCYGYHRNTSPHIDLLAKDSLLFEKTVAQNPWTLPSFASMFTSLYPSQHKVGLIEKKLAESYLTLAEILKGKGYYNIAFTGGAYLSKEFGLSQGFDVFEEFNRPSSNDIEEIISAAIEWLEKEKKEKFFMFIHSYQPHSPYWPPADYDIFYRNYTGRITGDLWKDVQIVFGELESKYKTIPSHDRERLISLYDGDILYTDVWIGRFIKTLKELNLYEESLIIFTSDHGEEFNEHGAWEHGHTLYKELLNVPLIIKFPNGAYKGVADKLAELIDIMPTILDFFKIKINHKIDGQSLLRKSGNNFAYSQAFPKPNLLSFQEGNIKIIFNFDKRSYEIFNLNDDPDEKNNIFTSEIVNFYKPKIKLYPQLELKKEAFQLNKKELSEEVVEKLRALGYIK